MSGSRNHRNPISGVVHGRYTWCSACQRVNTTEEWVALAWHCCHCGAGANEAQRWVEIAEVQGYPLEPVVGQRYPWGER